MVIRFEGEWRRDFLGGEVVENLPANAGDTGSIPGPDPTCREAAKPMHHNNWACALEPTSHNYWAHVTQLLKPTSLEPVATRKATTIRSPCTASKSSSGSQQLEKPHAQQWRPNAAKNINK